MILLIHIDNITIVVQSNNIINMIKNLLQLHIKITDRGKLHWLLGIEIKHNQNKQTIMMRQKHYIENVLIQYNLQNKKNLQTLM